MESTFGIHNNVTVGNLSNRYSIRMKTAKNRYFIINSPAKQVFFDQNIGGKKAFAASKKHCLVELYL